MRYSATYFFPLRIYKKLSTLQVLNLMMCNKIMKSKAIVARSSDLYNISSRILTKRFTNFLINQTFCRGLTAGNTLQQANNLAQFYRKQGISVILDYCAEGQVGVKEFESQLDEHAKLFAKSAQSFAKNKNEMVSIKVTCLVDMNLLKKMNDAVLLRDKLWKQNNVDNIMTAQQAFNGLQKIYSGVSDQNFKDYLKTIHKYEGPIEEFSFSEVDFKMNHHPYYVYEEQKNKDFVVRLFMPIDYNQEKKLQSLRRRLDEICQPHAKNENNFRILVDAEQTYVQRGIQSVSEQLQQRYNKQQVFIFPTLQNYLKRSVERAKFEIIIAKRKNLFFAAKLVRGAYIVQQTDLAEKNNYENPIVDNFEKTTQNYYESFRLMASSFNKGEIVVASHNEDTVNDTAIMKKQINSGIKISYAQLLGLADHLTFNAKKEGHSVYKLLPWANTDTMVPYMIRRAIQLSQMRYPLDTQFDILKDELKIRLKMKSENQE